MGKSYVLKDTAGKPVGYVQQAQGEIRCRMQGVANDAQMLLFFEGDFCRREEMRGQTEERVWRGEEAILLGAYVLQDHRRAADTGEAARRLYAQAALREARPPVKETQEEQAEAKPLQEAPVALAFSFPERRWPQPPCWPEAVYREGAWREG